jgi:hypothetical protein
MALRIRRGTDAQRSGVTLEMGEIVWTTDGQQLFVGNGVTQGGTAVIGAQILGYGLAYDSLNKRIEVTGLTTDDVTQGTNNKYFSNELAVDAVGAALVAGNLTNVGITFTYSQTQDDAGRINATVALDGVGISAVVDDTAPQLGGSLDLNSHDITGTGNIDITGSLTIGNGFSLTGDFDNGDLIISMAEMYSPVDADNARLSLDTHLNLNGKSINTGAGNETTSIFNIRVSAPSGNFKVLENAPLYGQVIKAHNGVDFVDSAGISFFTQGTITTGSPTVPASCNIFVGNGVDGLDGTAGVFTFNNDGSLVAPIMQVGVWDTSVSDDRPTAKGMITFNDTTGKFQGYNGTAWVDLS